MKKSLIFFKIETPNLIDVKEFCARKAKANWFKIFDEKGTKKPRILTKAATTKVKFNTYLVFLNDTLSKEDKTLNKRTSRNKNHTICFQSTNEKRLCSFDEEK